MEFVYTDKGLLGEMVDGVGSGQPKTFAFAYDMTQGNKNIKLVSVTDPRGNATSLDYYSTPDDDPAFRWSTKTVTDRSGNATSFEYLDPDGPQGPTIETTVTDAESNSSTYVTDGRGRPTSATNALDQTTSLAWSTDNKVTQLTEPGGAVTTWDYDPLTGYPLEIVDAEANANSHPGTTLSYQRTMGGHVAEPIAKTSPEGRVWTFSYTDYGDLESVTDPIGNTTAEEGDYTTTYTYDQWGQLLTATDANGNTTTNSDFDPNGYPQTITDPLTNTTTFVYDERGQVTDVTDPLGVTSTQAYDTFGRPLESTTPKDQDSGEVITTPAPDYDPNDNVVVATAPNGAQTHATYDPADRVTDMVAPVDNPGDPERRTTFGYDAVGNLVTQTEPKGNLTPGIDGDFTTTNTYNAIYQLTEVTNADGDTISYTYDGAGNLETVTEPRLNEDPDNTTRSTTLWYDLNHRVRAEIDALGKSVITEYDWDGVVTSTRDKAGVTTTVTSDARGMPVEVRAPFKDDGGTTVHNTTRYEYDEVGNQTKTLTPRAVAAGTDEAFVHETVFDELNRPVEQIAPYDPADTLYNTPDSTLYDYDPAGRLASVSAPPSDGQTLRNETSYEYYDNGWLASSRDPWGIITSYDYNQVGQQTARTLTSAGGSSSRTMGWTYFPDGKLASRTDNGVPAGLEVALVDNSDFNNRIVEGGWLVGDGAPELYGPDTHVAGAGDGSARFTWQLHIPRDGTYEVFAYQNGVSNAATDAPYEITHAGGTDTVRRDQTQNAGEWVSLGSYSFNQGDSHNIALSNDANGPVLADAVKLVRDNSADPPADPRQIAYGYDPNGNMVEITDSSPDRQVDSYTISYTGLNQADQVQEHAAGSVVNTTAFSYNANGAIKTVNHDAIHSTYTYDVRNLVDSVTNGTSASDPDPKVTNYTYTDRGQVLQETKGNGNTVDYTYYLNGAVESTTETKPDGTLVSEHLVDYNPNGHRISDDASVMDADNPGTHLNTTTTYDYDPRDRLASVIRTGDGAGNESYTHDANNNVIVRTIDGATTSYNYDRNRLLTASTGGAGATSTYNYDPFGRLDTVTASGQTVQRNIYDGFDNIIESQQRQDDGSMATTAYGFDPLGRTTETTTGVGTPDEETTNYNYLGTSEEVLTEEVAGQVTKSYQYSPWGQRLSQTVHNDDGTQDDGYYGYNLHTDVEQVTGPDGNTDATYGYTAYGDDNPDLFTGLDAPTAGDPTQTEPYNVYRYNAKRWDPNSGNYDMGFRNYNPGLNRFLSRDMYNGALANMGLTASPYTGNPYAFTAGNPISGVELDGHRLDDCADETAYCPAGAASTASNPWSSLEIPDGAETATFDIPKWEGYGTTRIQLFIDDEIVCNGGLAGSAAGKIFFGDENYLCAQGDLRTFASEGQVSNYNYSSRVRILLDHENGLGKVISYPTTSLDGSDEAALDVDLHLDPGVQLPNEFPSQFRVFTEGEGIEGNIVFDYRFLNSKTPESLGGVAPAINGLMRIRKGSDRQVIIDGAVSQYPSYEIMRDVLRGPGWTSSVIFQRHQEEGGVENLYEPSTDLHAVG